jgi:hypothetical protein
VSEWIKHITFVDYTFFNWCHHWWGVPASGCAVGCTGFGLRSCNSTMMRRALLLLLRYLIPALGPAAVHVATAGGTVGAEVIPRTYGWHGPRLASLRAQFAAGTLPEQLHPAMNALKRSAEKARSMPAGRCDRPGPWSVVDTPQLPPSGDPHDLFSFGTYSWPCNAECNQSIIGKKPSCSLWWTGRNHKPKPKDCDAKTGLPWIGHDGFHNPSGQRDEHCGDQMTVSAVTLALAGYLQSNEAFLAVAAEIIRTWFLDSKTAMNPNLQYAAIKPPPFNGTGSGIIWSSNRWNSEMTDAVALLTAAASTGTVGGWDATDALAWHKWNVQYLNWLLTSENGAVEARATNNHHTWLAVESIALALTVENGSTSTAAKLAQTMIDATVPGNLAAQITASGAMPREIQRANPISYNCMNIRGLINLVQVTSHITGGLESGGLFHFRNASGCGSIPAALDFLLPFATGAKPWPYGQANGNNATWTGLAVSLRQAAIISGNATYEDSIALLPWGEGDWPSAWEKDVTQLLYPSPVPDEVESVQLLPAPTSRWRDESLRPAAAIP